MQSPGVCCKRKSLEHKEPRGPPAKKPAVAMAEATESSEKTDVIENPEGSSTFELVINFVSGGILAKVAAEPSWSANRLKKVLQDYVEIGKTIKSLLKGHEELSGEETLSSRGVSNGDSLQVVLVSVPTLHSFKPCSARELSSRRGCYGHWEIGGESSEHIVEEGVQHRDMSCAPLVGREVACAMATAAPSLEKIMVVSSESDERGEIIVISNPGDDAKLACIKALAILEVEPKMFKSPNIHDAACLEERDWNSYLDRGFNMEDDDEEDEDEEGHSELLALTGIMAKQLTRHFHFSLDEGIVVAPVIFGGFASDGSIVGVLSGRVWT